MSRRKLIAMLAVMVPLAGLAITSPALAAEKEKHPTGDFAVFNQCPTGTPGVLVCLYSQTLSGEVTLNKQTVPITSTITLQGGIAVIDEAGDEVFVGASNGETLSKTPQNVPGGLLDIINCTLIKGEKLLEKLAREACKLIFENKTTGLYATTELARPASEIGINTMNLKEQEGTALSLPVKIHLESPLLGSECYIGSTTSPVTLALTTGTTKPNLPNKPITGAVGEARAKHEFTFIELIGNVLVNNEFSAPGATGCGGIFSPILDKIINEKIGIPSVDGQNTAIQNNYIREGEATAVTASE
jgi:hypothetical protein